LLAALVAVVGASAYAQVLLNAWNQPFYNALSRKDVSAFIAQLGVFAEIAAVLLVLNIAQAWLNSKSKLVLRRGWLRTSPSSGSRRCARAPFAGRRDRENPDQRIHEDARHLTELSTDLGIGLLQSTFAAAELHRRVVDPVRQHGRHDRRTRLCRAGLHGVVRAALFRDRVAGELARRPSADRLNIERYAREAQFRFDLVRVNEEIEGVTLDGGEADEKERLDWSSAGVVKVFEQIVLATTWLTA